MILEMPRRLRISIRKNYNLEQENKIYNGYQRSHTYFNYNQNMHDRAIIPRKEVYIQNRNFRAFMKQPQKVKQ